MQRMLVLGRETFLGHQLLIPHKGYGTTSKPVSNPSWSFFFVLLAALVLCGGAYGLSLVAMSVGHSPVVPGLMPSVASLTERGF